MAALHFHSIAEMTTGRKLTAASGGRLVGCDNLESGSELFLISDSYQERASLISLTHGAACTADAKSGELAVVRKHIMAHEIFCIVPAEGVTFCLKSAHGRFVTNSTDGFTATGLSITGAVRFCLKEPLLDQIKIDVMLGFEKLSSLIDYNPAYVEREIARFNAAVQQKLRREEPVIVLVGPGPNVRDECLHITTGVSPVLMRSGWLQSHDDKYFSFNADRDWGIPDSIVDFIYHEDVFEHISQKSQLKLLAESFRVLKPGGVHRINTPCLREAMRAHSKFTAGAKGVYEAEWDRWGHTILVSHPIMREYSEIVGYSRCFSAVPNFSLSPYFRSDTRPNGDRHPVFGNMIVDLVK
jgi:hypothetical protein